MLPGRIYDAPQTHSEAHVGWPTMQEQSRGQGFFTPDMRPSCPQAEGLPEFEPSAPSPRPVWNCLGGLGEGSRRPEDRPGLRVGTIESKIALRTPSE